MQFEPSSGDDRLGQGGSGALTCERAERDGCVVVSAAGEVDWATAPALREHLAAAMDSEPPRVVLDLAGVTFLDSSGLSVLIRAQRQAGGRGGWVRLVVPGDRRHIRKLLQMTSADRMFEIYRSLEAALGQAGEGRDAAAGPERLVGLDYGPANWPWPGAGPGLN